MSSLGLLRLMVFWLLAGMAGLWPAVCWALDPGEILVLANAEAVGSVGLARYYMQKRQIPRGNLLELRMTDKELCSREEYEDRVARVVRQYLRERGTAPRNTLFGDDVWGAA